MSEFGALLDKNNPSGRSYPEDFKLENGNYLCRCHLCSRQFCGHKRRLICKECANSRGEESGS